VRPDGARLVADPHLPPEWNALELGLHLRGQPFRLRIDRRGVSVDRDDLVARRVGGQWEVTRR
jgi:cellobiose phosphorylase